MVSEKKIFVWFSHRKYMGYYVSFEPQGHHWQDPLCKTPYNIVADIFYIIFYVSYYKPMTD